MQNEIQRGDIIVIYHGNCADGFGAAWAARQRLGDAPEYFPGVYQQDPPDCRGKVVILVDFCYKPAVMEEIARQAQSVLVLDHHKSAMESFLSYDFSIQTKGVPIYRFDWDRYELNVHQDDCENVASIIYYLFDMNRSGAMISWNFFHPEDDPPGLIEHIQDRDLWKFKLEGTREIQACLFSHPYDFKVWDALMMTNPVVLHNDGIAIERKHFKDIDELLTVCERRMVIAGHDVPVASLPYTLSSDAGHKMAQGQPFAACYWDTPQSRIFSLRSAEDGVDVSEVATQYGGGGHKNAAGFAVPRDHELARA